jgi:hypothetical protein
MRPLVVALLLLAVAGCARPAREMVTYEVWLVPQESPPRPAFRDANEMECWIAARSLLRREREAMPQMTATYECYETRTRE